MGHLGRGTYTVHLISGQSSQEGIKCTKAKDQLQSYGPNIYTVNFKAATKTKKRCEKFREFISDAEAANKGAALQIKVNTLIEFQMFREGRKNLKYSFNHF